MNSKDTDQVRFYLVTGRKEITLSAMLRMSHIALSILWICSTSPRAEVSGLRIKPFLQKYCFDCHADGVNKGNFALDTLQTNHFKDWKRVLNILEREEMPPNKKLQPAKAERAEVIKNIEQDLLGCNCDKPRPGRVTLRRLNRVEYSNTIRELLGVNFDPAADFPVDGSGYGFDTVADALSTSPTLFEKYLEAADKVVDAALGIAENEAGETRRYPVDLLEVGYNAKQRGDGWVTLNSIEEDDVAITIDRALAAEFLIRVRAYAREESTNEMKLTFMLDKKPVKDVFVGTNQEPVQVYEAPVVVPPGKHRLRAVVRRNKMGLSAEEALQWKSGPQQKGAVFVQWLEIVGPNVLKTDQKLSIPGFPSSNSHPAALRTFLGDFASRAFRRPAESTEVERLLELTATAQLRGSEFKEAVAVALKAVLVSPHFLFREELPSQLNTGKVRAIDDYALAARLSFFLWSSMPDAELFLEAKQGTLQKNLEPQVRRMLKDDRAKALVLNFGGQWLEFRMLSQITPDDSTFRDFDEALREAMHRETELLFSHIIQEDRSVLEFLTADYTFVNARLARHYGLPEPSGDQFQRVSLAGTERRGVLTHASVLTLTSNPTRTSPVKRGKWVLDNLLNAPPPPPPPEVPELRDGEELKGTLRQRLEEHRSNALCASCHARMDPLGFALENFDGIGAWRTADHGDRIAASGELTTGETFNSASELSQILANQKREQFLNCLIEKMLTYALGRGMEIEDRCAIRQIGGELRKQDYRFSALVVALAQSVPFRYMEE